MQTGRKIAHNNNSNGHLNHLALKTKAVRQKTNRLLNKATIQTETKIGETAPIVLRRTQIQTVKRKINLLILSLFAVLLMSSCDQSRVFEDNIAIENNVWKSTAPVTFAVDIADTTSGNNFYLNIRHAEGYQYSNLYVFMKTKFPNGKTAQDTVELVLQDPNGKWTGSGLGDIWDSQIMFKRNLRFPLKGKYEFSVYQAMQTPELPMIMEVGMRIEKYQPE